MGAWAVGAGTTVVRVLWPGKADTRVELR